MAKVSFTKLNKIKSSAPTTCQIGTEEITVQTYLPIEDKIDLIARVVEQSGGEEEGFYNIIKLKVFYILEMIKTYTNINFTEKQLSDSAKLYDLIVLNKIWEPISEAIPQSELEYVWESTLSIAREITDFNHSFLGILKSIRMDVNNLDEKAIDINNTLANKENLEFLSTILEKMG